ncbi:unnamed protein product [Musa banksii]
MDFALFGTRFDIQSPMNFHQTTNTSSLDFGRIVFHSPSAVLRPRSPKEISLLLSSLSASSSFDKVTVAARGAGHSIHDISSSPGWHCHRDGLPALRHKHPPWRRVRFLLR